MALLLTLGACGSGATTVLEPGGETPQAATEPGVAELQSALIAELDSLGVDWQRATSSGPAAGSEVFDLLYGKQQDGSWVMAWTERLVGDYDQNGEVTIADVTPIAANWQAEVDYFSPALKNSIPFWPQGNPELDGAAGDGNPPADGSGAQNWRRARVDGDANGLVNISDITPLAQHFGQRMDGYRIYRRPLGSEEYELLPNPIDDQLPYTIGRTEAGPRSLSSIDGSRPVRYGFTDNPGDGDFEYAVAAYDASTDTEGPFNITGIGSVLATLEADVLQGEAPLTVNFDASGSSVGEAQLFRFTWDFDNNGELDDDTELEPFSSFTYQQAGKYLAVVYVYDNLGNVGSAGVEISVGIAPSAVLKTDTALREVPLSIRFSAEDSLDLDGEIEGYEWDLDNDGEFELDTGSLGWRELEFDSAGSFTIGVRVTDDSGAVDTESLTIELVDNYLEQEQNDRFQEATPIGSFSAGGSASGFNGSIGQGGYDGDDVDWYAFDVDDGMIVDASLLFSNADANLTLTLFGPDGAEQLQKATSSTDNEQIIHGLKFAARYYLRVTREIGPGAGVAEYSLDLSFADLVIDEQEEDDTLEQANDLGPQTGSVLPGYWGRFDSSGPHADDADWWRISVSGPASLHFQLCFSHAEADLDLRVYSGDGTVLLGASQSVTDNEDVSVELDSEEVLVLVSRHGGDSGNYILGWSMQN
ncbi:MAG: hypothetical protein H7A35_06450 [Planctomycetales bacterium]|nr:hypothetical protein [bacterium]UNM09697.1 MAG: hypothetical protein H7A35_06450 [Planctomycetales bacterium]